MNIKRYLYQRGEENAIRSLVRAFHCVTHAQYCYVMKEEVFTESYFSHGKKWTVVGNESARKCNFPLM